MIIVRPAELLGMNSLSFDWIGVYQSYCCITASAHTNLEIKIQFSTDEEMNAYTRVWTIRCFFSMGFFFFFHIKYLPTTVYFELSGVSALRNPTPTAGAERADEDRPSDG